MSSLLLIHHMLLTQTHYIPNRSLNIHNYEYVQTDNDEAATSGGTHNEVTDLAGNVNIDLNPSYSLPQGDQDIKLQDNPSYDKVVL